MCCSASWLAGHPCWAPVSQGQAAGSLGHPGPPLHQADTPTPSLALSGKGCAQRKWRQAGVHTLHPKGPCPTSPASAIHAPTLGQQSYFPTQPPLAFLFPSACPGALASRPRGPAVPPAPSLETSGEGPGQLQSTHPHSLWNHLWGSGPRLQPGSVAYPSSGPSWPLGFWQPP